MWQRSTIKAFLIIIYLFRQNSSCGFGSTEFEVNRIWNIILYYLTLPSPSINILTEFYRSYVKMFFPVIFVPYNAILVRALQPDFRNKTKTVSKNGGCFGSKSEILFSTCFKYLLVRLFWP